MATLKEISASNPSAYRVIDSTIRKGEVKTWSDRIEIIFKGKSKFCTRKGAYKYGLAEKA
jgi:hypothetical protein